MADVTTPAATATEAAPPRVVSGALLTVAMVLVALNLRSPITSVPPELVRISDDLHLSGAAAGLLTTLPVLCMGLFAPVAQALAARFGRESTVLLAVLLILAGTLVRLGGGVAAVLYLGAFVAGVGIAVTGTLLPGVVKAAFPRRGGLMTGLYMAGMMGGAALASQLTVPLANALGSWQRGLAVWSVFAVVALALWTPVVAAHRRHHAEAGTTPRAARGALPWRSTTAWLLAAYLFCNSWEFYTQVAWIPATYESYGWAAGAAAGLLTIFTLTQAVSGIGGPALADRVPDLRTLVLPSVILGILGTAGVAWLPQTAPLLWMVLLGLGLGAGFALGLVYLVVYARSPEASARLTALAFLVSYTCASIGPVVFGVIRDATDSWRVPWTVLVVIGVVQLAFVLQLSPRRTPVS